MSKKRFFLLLIFAFLCLTQNFYAENLPLSAQEQISDDKTASSLSKTPVHNQTATVSTEEPPVSAETDSFLTQDESSNETANLSTQEPPVTDKTASSLSQPSVHNETSKSQESFVGKNIFSFELAYLRTALKNNGWGIGLSFEQSLFHFFSLKGRFSHVTMFPQDLDFNITTVGIGAEVLFYPFGNGLDKLYFGLGNETDFFMYLSNSLENSKDTTILIYPKIGWKQNFFNLVFLDLFLSYNIFLTDVPTLNSNINLLERGIQYGAKFKFNLPEIWTFAKNKLFS